MKNLGICFLGLCLVVALGCSGIKEVPRPPVPQDVRGPAFSVAEFARSLTVDQLRKANAGGLAFSELTPEQQQAVSAMWGHYAAILEQTRAEGLPGGPAGPVEEARLVLVGYAEAEGATTTLDIEFRRGKGRASFGEAVKRVPAAIREAGVDLVAAGLAEPPGAEEAEAAAKDQ